MTNHKITHIPEQYQKAVIKEKQGSIVEVTYSVKNYINHLRKLVTNQNIDSKVIGRETMQGDAIEKKCNVYLPAGYDKNDVNKKYNVLYLLHGVGGNRFEWLYGSGEADGNHILCNIIDNLIVNGDIEPVIVVFPEGRSAHDWQDNSFNAEGTNMLGFYYFDYELRYDLIPYIESNFNTYANIDNQTEEGVKYNRLHRALAGLSMGGMQSINLGMGGHRCDSSTYIGSDSRWKNGLEPTVLAPGMLDLFAYIGAFSNAPTSSNGKVVGATITASDYNLNLFFASCGDADGIAYEIGYVNAMDGLLETAGSKLGDHYRVIIREGQHDFKVWNNGVYNFLPLAFKQDYDAANQKVENIVLE